ncbi:hypothetical protein [Pedobacter zeae]|uniref:Uncharacterized protein n=1 Tax=Pedobacter zeae TaxID=1737356 RepID=A0A7W6K7R4_9SPHI|nr:hypothetical protein [Pedobacter zeae]MBB4106724.1 hypothetical protein [Pedobacter zeae]GGH03365.1 hypothetical protein GCM10007422_18370 [Pedobacter zeae]
MKTIVFRLTLLFQLLAPFSFAQRNAGLKALLNKNSEFIFPQTPDKVSTALGVKTVFYEDANDQPYAKWVTKSGMELYSPLGEDKNINEIFFVIPEDIVVEVEDLPFNLVMNRTTSKQSAIKFRREKIRRENLGEDTMFPKGTKLSFKKGKRIITLMFDSKSLLKSLSITTDFIDASVN